ncbi:MAG: hypothetical protein J6N52_03625, partial [Clostridia bacterium]|nr:hypothetical protein [Clostridia bacterium]
MRKIICSILMAAMLLGSANLVCVSADGTSVDFNDITDGTLEALPAGFVRIGADSDPIYYAEGEKFGKSKDDKALRIGQYWNNNGRFRWYQARYNVNKDVTGSEYIHLSTEMALEYGTADRWLSVGLTMANAKTSYPEFRFANLDANGGDDRSVIISFPGTDETIVVPERSWIRIDLVMNTATGMSDIYYNGTKTVSDHQATYQGSQMTQSDNIRNITGVYQAEFGINQLASNGSYLNNNTYIDNLICNCGNTYPEITEFVPYDEVNFSAYTGGLSDLFIRTAENDDCTTMNAVKSVFGKDKNDTSMDIKTSRFYKAGTDSPARWQQIRYNNPAPEYMDNKSTFWRISFSLAYTGAGMNRWIGLRYKMGNGSTQSGEAETVNVIALNGGDSGVTLKIGGQSVNVSASELSENKWMKFDIIVSAATLGTAAYDVYLNRQKLTSSSVVLSMPPDNKSWYSLSKITQLLIGVNHLWSDREAAYPEADTYIDDISIRHYGAFPSDAAPEESPRKLILGRYDGFADTGAVRGILEDVTYNGEKCTRISGSAVEEDSDLYLNSSAAPTAGTFTETISFIATDTADSIYFATGSHTPLTEKIPMSEFDTGT